MIMPHDPKESLPTSGRPHPPAPRADTPRAESRPFLPDPMQWEAPDSEDLLSDGPARVVDLNAGYFSGVPAGRSRGEALMLTESLPLVLETRRLLLDRDYNLTWTNNFWMAMSYMHQRVFCGLIVDARVDSLEERYLAQFLEEYDERSEGRKVVLASRLLSERCRGQSRRHGQLIDDALPSPMELIRALGLESTTGKGERQTW